MAGLLALGALAGGAGEYLKQSDEKRKEDYQEVRDKRLATIKTTENIRQEGATTNENQRREGVLSQATTAANTFTEGQNELDRKSREKMSQAEIDAKGPPKTNTPAGSTSGHYEKIDGKTVWVKDHEQPATGTGPGSKASLELAKVLYRMKADGSKGVAASWKELQDQYNNDSDVHDFVEDTGEFGEKITVNKRKPGSPGMTEYINNQLHPESQVRTNDIETVKLDPERFWEHIQRQQAFKYAGGREAGIAKVKEFHPRWTVPISDPVGRGSDTGPHGKDEKGILTKAKEAETEKPTNIDAAVNEQNAGITDLRTGNTNESKEGELTATNDWGSMLSADVAKKIAAKYAEIDKVKGRGAPAERARLEEEIKALQDRLPK
jgi:hypothetical protein